MSSAYQDALYFLGVSLAYIVSFLLFRSPVGHRATNCLLGVAFFSMGWYNMVYLLTLTGLYTQVYWLAGWGPPLCFLISPCAFLYVRQTLRDKNGLDKRDWLHFLPFLIFFVDLLPFNMGLSAVSKAEYVHRAMSNYNEFYLQRISLIPIRWHFVLRPLQALIYLVFQWRLLARKREGTTKRLYRWLLTLTGLQTFFYVILAVFTAQGLSTGQGIYVTRDYQPLLYILFFCFFLVSVILLSYPDVLYGLRQNEGGQRGTPIIVPAIATIPATISVRPVNAKII